MRNTGKCSDWKNTKPNDMQKDCTIIKISATQKRLFLKKYKTGILYDTQKDCTIIKISATQKRLFLEKCKIGILYDMQS